MASDSLEKQTPDEKALSANDVGGHASPDAVSLDEVTWTLEEEKRLVRKIDRLVIPLLILAFCTDSVRTTLGR